MGQAPILHRQQTIEIGYLMNFPKITPNDHWGGNSGNARKKTFFFQEVFPYWKYFWPLGSWSAFIAGRAFEQIKRSRTPLTHLQPSCCLGWLHRQMCPHVDRRGQMWTDGFYSPTHTSSSRWMEKWEKGNCRGGLVGHVRPVHAWLRPTVPPPTPHPDNWHATMPPRQAHPRTFRIQFRHSISSRRMEHWDKSHSWPDLMKNVKYVQLRRTVDAKLDARDKIWQSIGVRTKTDHLRNCRYFREEAPTDDIFLYGNLWASWKIIS